MSEPKVVLTHKVRGGVGFRVSGLRFLGLGF